MSFRFDTPLLTGAYHFGNRGLGVLGSAIPSTGSNGPSYIYNDLTLPADANKEYMGRVVTPPGMGTFFAYEDGSFTYTGPSTSFVYKLFEDGVDKGNQTVSLNISSLPTATLGWTEADDIFAVAASYTASNKTATVNWTEANDSSSISVNLAGSINTVVASWTEAHDAFAITSVTTATAMALATSLTLTFQDRTGTLRANLTGMKWAFFDQATPDALVAPSAKGTLATTNSSGVLVLNITGTGLAPGATGWLVFSNSDGTATQSNLISFAGPVVVA